jgi:CMP-N-acetylneuraminic acid synthetase
MKTGKIKTIVPSRLGSQRVKLKGFRLLNKKPLIEYILDSLLKTTYFTDIYINSDSDLLASFAEKKKIGFYLREPALATSQSMIDDYLYDFMVNEPSDYLAVITPTTPFITTQELDQAWEYYAKSDFDTLISGEEIQKFCFYRGETVNLSRIGQLPRSQDLEPVVALNFGIAIYDCKKFISNYENLGWGVFTGKLGFFITSGTSNIDIDTEDDFLLAEYIASFKDSGGQQKPEYSDIVKHLIDKNIDPST